MACTNISVSCSVPPTWKRHIGVLACDSSIRGVMDTVKESVHERQITKAEYLKGGFLCFVKTKA